MKGATERLGSCGKSTGNKPQALKQLVSRSCELFLLTSGFSLLMMQSQTRMFSFHSRTTSVLKTSSETRLIPAAPRGEFLDQFLKFERRPPRVVTSYADGVMGDF